MALLQISVGDELKARIAARAAESGYDTVEQCVEALLRADVSDVGVDDEDLEEMLLRRLDSGPGIQFTPEFAERFKREIRERRPASLSPARGGRM
jgi:hypothetical protein